jgi:DNA-binding transcriptional MerR regulator
MGRAADVERALADVVELRTLAQASSDPSLRARLDQIADRRSEEIGPSVPKTRAAQALGVSLNALDKWIRRGAIPVERRASSSRQDVQTRAVVDLAVEIRGLRETGRTSALLATALARMAAPMGARGFFPDQARERRRELRLLTPAERVAQAIKLSRSATRIAASGSRARPAKGEA